MQQQLKRVGWRNCCISEITVAELLYGAECSNNVEDNKKDIEVIPVGLALSEYASQKAKLRKKGTLIDDLDLLIGSTAVATDCIMVTENVRHLNRVENIQIENWVPSI